MSELYKDLTIEDMPNDEWIDIAKICGLPLTIQLLEEFAGITISTPKNWDAKLIKKYIKKHYNGTRPSMRKIVKVCDVSERQVYKIYDEVENQLKLFDELENDEEV